LRSFTPSVNHESFSVFSHWHKVAPLVSTLSQMNPNHAEISGFRPKVDENCVLLICYAVASCNVLPTFRDNLSAMFREPAAACCLISDFHHEVGANCGLLGYYAVSSCNFLPTFRYDISVLSSRVWTTAGCVITQKSAVHRPRPPT
jgi:hypothetical protein